MAASTSLAGRIAPLFLRLAVGIIFVIAGLGKFFADMEVSGNDAALLANQGVRFSVPTPPPEKPPERPAEKATDQPAEKPSEKPGESPNGGKQSSPPPLMRLQASPRPYTAEDFPDPIPVQRVYGIALLVHRCAAPAPGPDGKARMQLLPGFLAARPWPATLAWTVGLVEIVAGVFIFFGLITRLSAFLIAGVMAGAIWLTEIGPAMQAGSTVLLVLPNRPLFDGAWMVLYLQFTLLMASLSLLLTGAGAISLDAIWLAPRAPARTGAIEVRPPS